MKFPAALAMVLAPCLGQAQLSAGATVGWSRSQHFDRSAPTIGIFADQHWRVSSTRLLFEQQLPATQRWVWLTDSPNLLPAGIPADGHLRRYIGSDAVVMLSVAADHLFDLRGDKKLGLRVGPGFSYASEHYASSGTVEDLTDGTTISNEYRYERTSSGVRFTAGAVLDVGVGEMMLDATCDLITFAWRNDGNNTSAWSQRVFLRFGAQFPLLGSR